MVLSWADIRQWNEGGLEETSYDLRTLRSRLEGACDDGMAAERRLISRGEAVDAMRARSRQLGESVAALVADVSELMMACAQACDGVWQVRTKVLDCEQLAQVSGVYLDPVTGHVEERLEELVSSSSSPEDDYYVHEKMALRRQAGADLRQMVAGVLALAEQVDADFVRRLAAVERGVNLSSHAPSWAREGAGARSQGLADLPDPRWSATEVSLWWSSLSTTEKQWLLDHHPEAIGNRDGVEFSWRDKANRKRITRELEAAQQEYDAAKAEYDAAQAQYQKDMKTPKSGGIASPVRPELNPPSPKRLTLAEGRLNDLKAIQHQFTSPHAQNQSLLTLDTSGGRIRAAVGIGDVDNADHVGVFVPGMATRVDSSLEGYTNDVRRLRDSALRALEQHHRAESVATVAWLGYDAPAALSDEGWVQVASTNLAQAGAERLTSFTEGLEASRSSLGRTSSHLSVLGHSYGSTTSGIAVDHVKTGVVDDLVMFGSPGSGVSDSRLYNLDSGRAYVSGVEHGDAVQGIGLDSSFGADPLLMDGVEHLSNQSDAEGNGTWPVKRHGTEVYLAEGSGILRDMGRVIGGVK